MPSFRDYAISISLISGLSIWIGLGISFLYTKNLLGVFLFFILPVTIIAVHVFALAIKENL